jgi:hypothetical protein
MKQPHPPSQCWPPKPPSWCQCGGSCDGSCQPNQPPSWGWWGRGLRQCYDQINELKQLIRCILQDMTTGPGGGIMMPIQGVTDGSAAKAGQVGEFVTGSSQGTVTTAANQTQMLSPLVLQPGDWDCQATLWSGAALNGVSGYLSPTPSGVTQVPVVGVPASVQPTPLSIWTSLVSAIEGGVWMHSGRAQANISVPTLLPFTLQFNILGAGTTAGNFTLFVSARRMR